MSYSKIDDGIIERLMLLGVSEDGINLYLRGIIWCNKHLSDGRIPYEVLPQLSQKSSAKKVAAHLIEKGRWVPEDGAWTVHDFLDWNDSRAIVLSRRERHAAIVKRSRDQSPAKSRDPSVTTSVTVPFSASASGSGSRTSDRYSESPRRGGRVVDHGGQLTRAEAIALQAQQHADEARAAAAAATPEDP